MGREIRRVPKEWQHPKDDKGHYIPLHSYTFAEAIDDWERYSKDSEEDKPNPKYYRPEYEDEPVAYQIYETVSEGTPVSPIFETEDEMLEYLLKKGHSEKAARNFIEMGWSFSLSFTDGVYRTNIDTLDFP